MMTREVLARVRADLRSHLHDGCGTCHRLYDFGKFPAYHTDIHGVPCHGNKEPQPFIDNRGIQLRYEGELYSVLDLLAVLDAVAEAMPE